MRMYQGAKNLMIKSDLNNRKKSVFVENNLKHVPLLLLLAEKPYVK